MKDNDNSDVKERRWEDVGLIGLIQDMDSRWCVWNIIVKIDFQIFGKYLTCLGDVTCSQAVCYMGLVISQRYKNLSIFPLVHGCQTWSPASCCEPQIEIFGKLKYRTFCQTNRKQQRNWKISHLNKWKSRPVTGLEWPRGLKQTTKVLRYIIYFFRK